MGDVTWISDYRTAAEDAPVAYAGNALGLATVFDAGFGGTPAGDLGGLPGFDDLAQSWHDKALCAETDPEAFFPEKGGSTREAKKICVGCEVRAECLEFALANDERFGIWGGLSERERRRLRRAS